MAYLIHYNKNHDPKNGRFAPGDGNGDGIIGSKKSSGSTLSNKFRNYPVRVKDEKVMNSALRDFKKLYGREPNFTKYKADSKRFQDSIDYAKSGKRSRTRYAEVNKKEEMKNPLSLQNMKKYTARAEIFCDAYKKYGMDYAVAKTRAVASVDNLLQDYINSL